MNFKIAIVIANPDFSFQGSNSAVASFLNNLGEALEKEGYNVGYFPDKKLHIAKPVIKHSFIKRIVMNFIKKVMPGLLFNYKFKNYFRRVDLLNHSFSAGVKGYDLVLEFCVYGSQVGSLAKTDTNSKHIVIFDSPLDEQFHEMFGKTGAFIKQIKVAEDNSLRSADLIICYSSAVKKFLIEKKLTESAINIVPCIVWKKKSNIIPDISKINIGFIGSFLSWHKTEILVQAFNQIAGKYPQSELILVGYGEEWQTIKKLADLSPYKDRIELTGYVSEDRLEEIKSTLNIGVMPGSNWYGSPLKLFEYAESGIPIIAPSTPTVNEYFKHNENALIIDPENELQSLTNHLIELIQSKGKRDQLSEAGLKMMQNDFAKERVMSKFVKLVNGVLNNEK